MYKKTPHVIAALLAITLLSLNGSYLANQYESKTVAQTNNEPAGTMRMMLVSEPQATQVAPVQDFSDFLASEKFSVAIFIASILILIINIALIPNKNEPSKYLKIITWGITGVILTPAILYYSLFV